MVVWTALAVIGASLLGLAYASDHQHLMPGQVSTAHGSLEDCSTCHTNIGAGRYGWLHALTRFANPKQDSRACLACHRIGKDSAVALSPHGVERKRLEAFLLGRNSASAGKKSTNNTNVAEVATLLFPLPEDGRGEIYCATCHKEHKGQRANLKTIPDGRCQACHNVKFSSFSRDHPEFVKYPFNRRTRIKFNHISHFGKHFPEVRKKEPELHVFRDPCTACHTTAEDRRHMSVRPFDKACASCHLGQITGRERATGTNGITFFTLPGLDLTTLKARNADVGEWPEQSEAGLTPLMKLLLAGGRERTDWLKVVEKLDLLDLTKATDTEISAVVIMAWEVKRLIHVLSTSRASGVLRRVGVVEKAGLRQELAPKLIATMPRDVLLSAQREWLPNLDAELAKLDKIGVTAKLRRLRVLTKAKTKPPPAKSIAAKDTKPEDRLVTNPKYGRWRINNLGELVQEGDKRRTIDGARAAGPPTNPSAETAGRPVAEPRPKARVAIDAEAWAEFGGWYRKDYAILYKPTGHKDALLKAWLDVTGRVYGKPNSALADQVFGLLSSKEAQGQCTKCHSIETTPGTNRAVQWRPASLADKKMRFTKFVHEPHFSLLKDRGCLTCHKIGAGKQFTTSYKSLSPFKAASNFKPVRKGACVTCHKEDNARQDCLLCHAYHVRTVDSPTMSTELPAK